MPGHPTPFSLTLLLLALAGCGSTPGLPAGTPDAAPDGSAPADVQPLTADQALPLFPDAGTPLADSGAPPADAGMDPGSWPGGSCILNADCPAPLACARGRCHAQCREARDCLDGRPCDPVTGGVGICLLPGEPSGVPAGPDAGSPPDAATMLWGLSRGTNAYQVTSATIRNDGCLIQPGQLVGLTLPVTYDAMTTIVSIGNLQGIPPMPSLGQGRVSANRAVLVRENQQGDAGGCTFRRRDIGQFMLFDHDKFTLEVTDEQSSFSAACPMIPPGGTCQSTWSWRMVKAP